MEQVDTNLRQQFNNGRVDFIGIPMNQAGTLGRYWNWRAGYVAGTLSHNHFLIQGDNYEYSIVGLNDPNMSFQGLDSEVKYESLDYLVDSEIDKSKNNFEDKSQLQERVAKIEKQYPYGRFTVVVYGSSIESVSDKAVNVLIAQQGKKIAEQTIDGLANVPGITGLWSNRTVLKSPNFNGKPFVLRVYQQHSNKLTDYTFTLKQ